MPRIAANGIELTYEEHGSGEVVVFIAGTACDRTIWGAQVGAFAGRYRCITFDNRDVGESGHASAAYTPRDMAADAIGLLEALDVPAAHIVGHSLGGATAQELALAAPERVRTLNLIGTWARNDEYTRTLFRTWQRTRRAFDDREFLEAFLLTGVGPTFLNACSMEALVMMFSGVPHPQSRDGFCRQVDADLAHDTADRLRRIAAPTLVVAGEEDAIFPRHHHRMLADGIPGASLQMIPNAGHTPLLEAADVFNQALASFFETH